MLPERRRARAALAAATAAANREGRNPRTDPAIAEARRRYALLAAAEYIDGLDALTEPERHRLHAALPVGGAR